MNIIRARNVNGLWADGLHRLHLDGVEQDSRAGRVLVAPWPVTSVYERPMERVLFDPVRDANPFFHLMESLWMLAGRDDAAFLNRYVGDFGKRFGEEDGRIHGAYGKRWRSALGFDQLDVVVEKLRDNPDDRQAVIQMWDGAQYEEWRGGINGGRAYGSDDLEGNWRDRPCNTHVYLRVRTETRYYPAPIAGGLGPAGNAAEEKKLDLTVLCRSNDIVWGAYGANAVHFSVLQEYLAGRVGVAVGKMYQFSNNWHGYVDVVKKFGDPLLGTARLDPYYDGQVAAMPMGSAWGQWDADLSQFMAWHDERLWGKNRAYIEQKDGEFVNDWFARVAVPLAEANWYWKSKYPEAALGRANMIAAPDWREACVQWMQRRMK